ncbi:MAG TPA: SDR family oxidoreductase [Spirochaetota bacterium]|nr:SDR family oxidoreductase [Spirochaetota bacterium]
MKRDHILITGVSSGLGRYLTELLLMQGYKVAGFTRHPSRLKFLKKKYPDTFLLIHVNINNYQQVNNAVKKVIKAFRKIGVLINNAGYGQVGPVAETSIRDIKKQFDINIFALINLTQKVIPVMRRQQQGLIINIGSSADRIVSPFNGVYAASKHALRAFSEALCMELSPCGINVTLAEPGVLRTDYNNKILKVGQKLYPDVHSSYKKQFKYFLDSVSGSRGMRLPLTGKKIIGIINKKNPGLYYRFDFYTRLLFFMRRFFPAPLYDYLIRKKSKL